MESGDFKEGQTQKASSYWVREGNGWDGEEMMLRL
jgi:hypothetical protein